MSHSHIWLHHSVTQSTYSEKNSEKKSIKMFSPHDKIPVCTRDTAGTGHGMPRCVKIQHRTRTRATRDPITVGIPIPVTNPTQAASMPPVVPAPSPLIVPDHQCLADRRERKTYVVFEGLWTGLFDSW